VHSAESTFDFQGKMPPNQFCQPLFVKYPNTIGHNLFLQNEFETNCFLLRCMECRRGLAMRILSVHLSVKRVICDKTKEKSVQIFISYERSFCLVF